MLKSVNNDRRPRRIPGRVPALIMGGLAAALVLAGCTAGGGEDSATGGGTVTVGTITHTRTPSATITRTVTAAATPGESSPGGEDPANGAGSASSAGPGSGAGPGSSAGPGSPDGSDAPASSAVQSPASAAAPVTTEPDPQAGSCPYLSDDDAAIMIGQRTGQTMIIAVQPQPICLFYRSDGGWMGTIRPIVTATEQQAVAAVDGHIPRADSSPADDPDGWAGGYMPLPAGTADYPEARSVYGVSKGERAIIVWTNQEQTVKGRRIAETAIGALGW